MQHRSKAHSGLALRLRLQIWWSRCGFDGLVGLTPACRWRARALGLHSLASIASLLSFQAVAEFAPETKTVHSPLAERASSATAHPSSRSRRPGSRAFIKHTIHRYFGSDCAHRLLKHSVTVNAFNQLVKTPAAQQVAAFIAHKLISVIAIRAAAFVSSFCTGPSYSAPVWCRHRAIHAFSSSA